MTDDGEAKKRKTRSGIAKQHHLQTMASDYLSQLSSIDGSIAALHRDGNWKEARSAAKKAEELASRYAHQMRRIQININRAIFASTPNEILLEVFKYLGSKDLYAVSSVCRRWNWLVQENPTLWLQQVELKGTCREIAQQWTSIKKKQHLQELVVCSLSLHHDEQFEPLDEDDMDEPDYDHHYEVYYHIFEKYFSRGFLAIFPFKMLRHLQYKGAWNLVDHSLWLTLQDCQNLSTLIFTSSAEETGLDGYGHWEDLAPFPADSSISQCHLRHLELNTKVQADPTGLQLDSLRKLKLLTILKASTVQQCIQSAASTLEELQISAAEQFTSEYCRDEACAHNDTACIEYLELDGTKLPKLCTFWAVSDSNINTVGEREREWGNRSTKISYKLEAPNVKSMTIEGYLGWDQVLFDSCCNGLEEVHINLNNHNVEQVYECAIGKLSSCKRLTLKTIFPLHTIVSQEILHPFGGRYDEDSETPAKDLIKLEELTLIGDENITGQALLRFVRYKAKLEVPLKKLVVKDCPQVRGNVLQTLRAEVKICTIESKGNV